MGELCLLFTGCRRTVTKYARISDSHYGVSLLIRMGAATLEDALLWIFGQGYAEDFNQMEVLK